MSLVQPHEPVLVLCAHPDDEIGCGGYVNLLSERGNIIHYVYLSTCSESTQALGFEPQQLIQECKQSCKILGIKEENILGYNFPVRHFPQHRQGILEELVKLRTQIKPRLVIVPCREDIHQDHATLAAEALRAFKHSNIIGYEFPWNLMSSHLDLLIRLEQRHIHTKLSAWKCYKTQSSRIYHDPRVLESLARIRGVQANVEFAESYEIMRMVI